MSPEAVLLVRLISYIAFLVFQMTVWVLAVKSNKDKTHAKSMRTLKKIFIFFPIFAIISAILGMLYKYEIALALNAFPMVIGSICAVFLFIKASKQYNEEVINTKKLEAEALRLAEINNTTDETYLRAKNLLPLGNEFLVLTANAIRKKVTHQDIYDFILEKMMSEAFADGGIILIVDGEDEVFKVKATSGVFPPPYQLPADVPLKQDRVQTSLKYAQFDFHGNLFADIASGGKPVLVQDPSTNSSIYQNGDESFLKAGSYLFLTLVSDERVIGLVALSRAVESRVFRESDMEICQILGEYCATSIRILDSLDEESEKDLIASEKDLATKIQKLLLPTKMPKIPGIDAGVYFHPALGICSDYYDILWIDDDKMFFVMMDVASKSIQASVIMIMIRTLLNLIASTDRSTDEILDLVNRGVTKKIGIDLFAGLALILYKPSKKKIYYSGAGNISISVFHSAERKFERITQTTDAIGITVNSKYEVAESNVKKGDVVLLYSDGAIEAVNKTGKRFSLQKIYQLVGTNAEKPCKEISKDLEKAYSEFTKDTPEHDDRSVLMIKID